MRFKVILLLLAIGISSIAWANGDKGNEEQRRSTLYKGGTPGSYPRPFQAEFANPTKLTLAPAVSQGYYIVDSDDPADAAWKPYGFLSGCGNGNPEVDLNCQPETWYRIISGAHQFPMDFWTNNPEGNRFFQNPATKSAQFPYGTDSTDNAFAGPIPIGFPFFFNGIRMDSFYVSTNGLVAFSNRRYFYGSDGSRIQQEVTPGNFSFYDPQRLEREVRPAQGASGAVDPLPDDYGYRCIALGVTGANMTNASFQYFNSQAIGNQFDGLRNPTSRPTTSDGITPVNNFTNNPPLVMPFWGDLQVSVYNSNVNFTDDYAAVRYKRSVSGDKLIIWFQNVTPRNTWAGYVGSGLWGTVNYGANTRPGNTNFVQGSAAVILNRLDSSICIYYTDFQGVAFINNRPFTAPNMFRMNTTNAVRGPARHVNYNSLTGTQGADANYVQSTFYFTSGGAFPGSGAPVVFATGTSAEDGQTPATNLIVCYKQWKNTVRAVTTEYRVRPRDANQPLTYSVVVPSASVNNFELLAGDQRLGGIVPISVFQNLSNDIQGPGGVNYQAQNIKFRARFRIINQATNNTVYNRLVRINSFFSDSSNWTIGGYRLGTFTATATPVFQATTPYPNSNGVPPYAYVQVQFPPFEPNEFIDGQIGRFRAVIIAEPVDSTDQGYRDTWPFDDTTNFTLFVMRRLSSFNEDIREYHVINGVPMPSVLKFVNIGGEVNDGDNATNNPPPPRGEYAAANNSQIRLQTPVVQLNRLIDNAEPPTSPGGDELRSFPIDLRTRRKAVLSLAYHRAPKVIDNNTGFMNYIRGWADNTLVGPEPRVAFLEGGPLAQASGGSQPHDQLWVEFARPSLDQINNISTSNIPNAPQFEWNWHPRCCGQTPASTNASPNPAFSIFGGGGFRRGYSSVDVDSPFTLNPDLGLNIDLYDDGKDFEWKKIYLAIPDTFINAPNDGARNFRFRLRVRAIRHTWLNGPNDDADDFFVKNIRILFPTEVTDIEALSVIATWPFVETPASQATQIPLRVRIANNTGRDAQAFKIIVSVAGVGEENNTPWNTSRYVYYRNVTIPFLPGNRDIEVPFPSWNARESNNANTEDYTIATRIVYPGGDLEPLNDTTYSRFRITFGKAFSYYPSSEQNQVPQFTQPFYGQTLVGKGLNTLGIVSSGFNIPSAFGADGGSGSGQFAVRFSLTSQDTLLGFQAYFASLNADQNNVRFAVYDDQGQIPAAQPRANTVLRKLRGIDDLDGVPKYDTTSTYLLPAPLVLPPGEYWISVAQLSTVGLELGATGYRSGMQMMNFNQAPVPGGSNVQVYLDKTFRRRQRNGNLLNDVRFAFENSIGSGQWAQFTNTQGNMPYAHLDFRGFLGTQNSYTRGSWIPMLRPYLGDRAFGPRKYVQIDTVTIPVELTVFDGTKRTNAVDLWWETASEKNNSGFYVERRENSSDTWLDMTFVPSNAANGTSTKTQSYAFTDKSVKGGSSYQYRLRQVDLDNTVSYSGILNFSFDGEGVAELGSNTPNPFSTSTTIPYTVTSKSNVRLEVVDVLGNVVHTLVNTTVDNGTHYATWDGTDANGMSVANGSYLCRMVIGNRIETVKMSLVR